MIKAPHVLTLCALACVLALALSGALARAAVTHEFLPEASKKISEGVPASSGAPLAGPLSEPLSMTVDSGELFLADGHAANYRLDKFNASSGAFVSQFDQVPSLSFLHQGVAVGHASGEVYVGGDEFAGKPEGAVAVFSAAGGLLAVWKGTDTPSKAFGCFECEGTGDVAVDNSAGLTWAAGDVYVADPLHGVVDVFKPIAGGGEEYVARLEGPEPPGVLFGHTVSVAVSQSSGEVLVVDGETSTAGKSVDIFKPTVISGQYEFLGKLTGTPNGSFERVSGVSVDGGNGDIYVVEGEGRARVYQFNAAGEYLARFTGTPAGPFSQPESVAVDPASHHVYVGDHTQGSVGVVDAYGETLVIPDVAVVEPVSSLKPTSVTLRGTVNPDEAGEATCEFEYGTSTSYGQKVPCTGPVANGKLEVAVESVSITGLQPDTTYHYRLDATNKNGIPNTGECPEDCGEFTTTGPGIHGEWVSNVASTSATLNATINPHKAPTTHYFQYSTATTSGCEASPSSCTSVPAPPGGVVGSGEGDVEVTPEHAVGLLAGTTYHYRVVAVSELEPAKFEAFAGPDQTFTTQTAGAFALPDARAWEMVSPPDKLGARILPRGAAAAIQAAAVGDAITYVTNAPTEAEPQGFASGVQVLSTRGPGGWGSRDVTIPHTGPAPSGTGQGNEYRLSSSDLSLGVMQPLGAFDPLVSPEASEQTAYLVTLYLNGDVTDPCIGPSDPDPAERVSSCYRPLVTAANTPTGTEFGQEGGPTFVGATPDFSHVVLDSKETALTEGGPLRGLYEWSGGTLQLISLLPENGGPASVPTLGDRNSNARNAISADGSRVVWSAGLGEKHLYMRDTATSKTVQLDAGLVGTPLFQTASEDASRVFFTEDPSSTGKQGALYEYRVEGGELLSLTKGAEVQGAVLGASKDGHYIYFVADGVLAGNHNAAGEVAAPNANDLYVMRDGVATFIAILSSEDHPDWANGESQYLNELTARVSPSGRRLAFMSQRPLTGYDNRDALSGKPDEEVYLYDASANGGEGELICASCDPTGARPDGVEFGQLGGLLLPGANPEWPKTTWVAASIPGWTPFANGFARYQSRYLSDNGRLFFNCNDALVPQDVNGTRDVYQYEPPGVGSCTPSSQSFSERSGGCIGLISSGKSPEESAFMDASATGSRDAEGHEGGGDVFFLTASKLAPQDYDTALDVYDAHECTAASPCFPEERPKPPSCETEASCKSPPSLQPEIFGAPASATFSGIGNASPPAPGVKPNSNPKKCRKGFVKKHGRCVRKRARKAKRSARRRPK